jgi:hypothetical protein
MNQIKVCPFCAEDIKTAAIVCKHCKRDLPAIVSLTKNNTKKTLLVNETSEDKETIKKLTVNQISQDIKIDRKEIQVEHSNVNTNLMKQQFKTTQRLDPSCDGCGLSGELKRVQLYENVGMLILRNHRSVTGNFCKNCIDYYFWSFTGKTTFLGWWSPMSLIFTPFILFNNYLIFLSTRRMKKPSDNRTPELKTDWKSITIFSWAFIGLLIFSIIISI